MTLPENPPLRDNEQPAAASSGPPEADFPAMTDLPDDFTPLVRPGDLSSPSRARRRRARRTLLPAGEDARLDLLASLARRSIPSFEFFLFAILSGFLLGAGYLLDSDALLLLGLLLAPLLAPWAGLTLAAATGGWRFFFQTLATLAVAFLLVFASSALAGLFNQVLSLTKFIRAVEHAKLWPPDLFIVILGAVLLVIAFIRGEQRPILPGILLAYGLFLPAASAGFHLTARLPGTWPDGLFVALTHLALATLAGMVTFLVLRFRPRSFAGALLTMIVSVSCLAALVIFTGLAAWVTSRMPAAAPLTTPTPLGLTSPTPGLPPSATPGAPTASASPSDTPEPSITPTLTPAPSYALISASTGGGALVRTEPAGGTVVATLINGTVVQVLPQEKLVNTTTWVLIRALNGVEGWVLKTVLTATTPPALTPTP